MKNDKDKKIEEYDEKIFGKDFDLEDFKNKSLEIIKKVQEEIENFDFSLLDKIQNINFDLED